MIRARGRLTQTEPQAQGPVRTCVGCRERGLRSELVRLTLAPDAADGTSRVVVDERRALPGRGAWLHRDAACFEQAVRRRVLPRAFRTQGQLDVDGVRDAL